MVANDSPGGSVFSGHPRSPFPKNGMRRPRVLYILGSLAANEVGQEIVAILGRLSRSSFDPRVVTLGGREDLRDQIRELKVRTYSLGLVGSVGTLQAVSKVRDVIKKTGAVKLESAINNLEKVLSERAMAFLDVDKKALQKGFEEVS